LPLSFSHAKEDYVATDKIINEFRKLNGNIIVEYSTASDYLENLNSQNLTMTVFKDEFMS